MHDEQMGEQKIQIARILLERMSRRFYPLACRSFTDTGSTIDAALFALFRKKGLPFAESRKVRNSIVRKYVHFRLELASLVVKEDSRQNPFLESTMKDNLDFDITRSFSEEFDGVRKALLPFRPPFTMTGAEVIPLLSLLSGETGTNLSPLADDFTKETKGYLEKVKEESHRFMEALSFCDPRFHDTTKTELPFLLKQCICENLGMEQGGLVVESAQILMPLTEVTPFIARKELTPRRRPVLLPLPSLPGPHGFLLCFLYVAGQEAEGSGVPGYPEKPAHGAAHPGRKGHPFPAGGRPAPVPACT